MTIKQRDLYKFSDGDITITVLCRVDIEHDSIIGITTARSYKSDINKRVRKSYHNNRDKRLKYKHNYRDADNIIERIHNLRYKEARQTINFLGDSVYTTYLPKLPSGYVWHHTCYDHADPEANCVAIRTGSHLAGHKLLKKLGIEIPHINKGDE